MAYPPLVHYQSKEEYRTHFHDKYCRNPIRTHDGIEVRFRKQQFDHCFAESIKNKDDTFSEDRATRIDWIEAALKDPQAEHRVGWDNSKKCLAHNRRVAIVVQNYVVIIRIKPKGDAEFVTAYVATNGTIGRIRRGPLW